MASKPFFDEQAEQSEVKTAIVTKYFGAWSKIILSYLRRSGNELKIGYVDLFAGPGRYKDGAKSTPLHILEQAIADKDLRNSLVTMFNDKDDANTSSLLSEISQLHGIDGLKFQPDVSTEEVGEEIVKEFEQMNLIPTLMFVDPWGYKGLSLRLINSVLKDWACECLFFFNYNRINMGLNNPFVKEHMDALFGADRGDDMRARLEGLDPQEREITIIEELSQALIEMGGKYTLPFRFRNAKGTRTSHHLIFVSKHPLGYKIMKEVMAKESSSSAQGVPSFEYSPATELQPLLFNLNRPLEDLTDLLLQDFAGKQTSMRTIYENHNVGLPYVEANYKEVLTDLEIAGKITGDPPHTKRRKRNGKTTCADKTVFTFPNS